jgi:hypothetical protein
VKVPRRRLILPRSSDLPSKVYTLYANSQAYVSGQPYNLSGCSAQIPVFRSSAFATPLFTLTGTPTSNGSVTLGGTLGTVTIVATLASSLLIGPGTFWAWLAITWTLGTTWRIIEFDWVVTP